MPCGRRLRDRWAVCQESRICTHFGFDVAIDGDGLALVTGMTDGAFEGVTAGGGYDAFVTLVR
jgi:hypothetical protein